VFRYDGDVRIYLVRHGDAVPEEDAGSDRDRWLSSRGREAARVLGRLLREQAVAPDVILSSPLPRAVQTAELLAASLDYLGTVTSLRCLEPAAQPRVASSAILSAGASVIVVSHEPAISALGAFLLGIAAFPQFRTAQCCALESGKPTFTARADLGQVLPLFVH
jgi:phosphohistidine phosphatase